MRYKTGYFQLCRCPTCQGLYGHDEYVMPKKYPGESVFICRACGKIRPESKLSVKDSINLKRARKGITTMYWNHKRMNGKRPVKPVAPGRRTK